MVIKKKIEFEYVHKDCQHYFNNFFELRVSRKYPAQNRKQPDLEST